MVEVLEEVMVMVEVVDGGGGTMEGLDRMAARMVEVDLHEIQNTSNMFAFETQSLGDSQGPANQTGLASEERLIEEAAQINELALMGSMLLSLLKFD